MPAKTETTTQTTWPEGVIARYLTDAGKALGDLNLAVTITEIERDERGGGVYVTAAECSGCPSAERFQWEDGFYDYGSRWHALTREEALARAEAKARNWAQSHAEKCRAMPRPGA
ncbi:hypothetical protein [Streptomyces bugieae]|uniref:Uncharacterized protein n=1 Tax=Streptomyces bugieae TaxID=3098223 RepID=A0ABU7NL34_9ACTN|nr:hypothetical protein [Streptomyces sp. DSM 41528]